MAAEHDFSKKVCLLGDPRSGKTDLFEKVLSQSHAKEFIDSVGVRTAHIGFSHELTESGNPVRVDCILSIWDINGAAGLRKMQALYSRGAAAGVVVVRPEDPDALDSLRGWSKRFRETAGAVPILVLLNLSETPANIDASGFDAAAAELGARAATSSISTPDLTRRALEELSVEIARAALTSTSGKRHSRRGRRVARIFRSKAGTSR